MDNDAEIISVPGAIITGIFVGLGIVGLIFLFV